MFSVTVDEKSIDQVVRLLENELSHDFVVWLQGEMGSGKTTLVRHFLRQAGLDENTPVVSPTYTIMNEYQIGDDWYAHLDLYRADDSFSLDEIGVRDTRSYKGIFLEWPEASGGDETLEPSHILSISYANDGLARTYQFSSF